MSVDRSNSPLIITPEEYQTQSVQIAAAKAFLQQREDKIDQGKQNYEALMQHMQQLEDKVRAGDEAK
jgi:hypothetical protein